MPHSERRKKRCGRDCTLSVRHAPDCSNFSLRFSFQFKPVGIVNESVQDRIRKSRIRNAPVPLGNRDLCRNEGGGVAKAVIEDFQNILCILDGNGIPHPIIKDQQAAASQGTQGGSEGPLGADLAEGVQ